LNLTSINGLPSAALAGLIHSGDETTLPSPLISLSLSNTNVGDDAAEFIASCKELEVLEVANTTFTGMSFQILRC
jgi:hypothetical protein